MFPQILSIPQASPRYLLIDCNNFFASCERVFRPDLVGKPIIVLSNNDGCVVARSNEAKKLGIAMGVPFFTIKRFVEAQNVVVFSSNYSLYSDISHRVMATIEDEVGVEIEQYSIDECFVPLSKALVPNAPEVAVRIKERVKQDVNIPVSIGIGATRTLAKLACFIAKKRTQKGLYSLYENLEGQKELFSSIPIDEVWGIGRKKAEKLKTVGIKNVYDFQKADENWIKRYLTITGYHTLLELRGIPCVEDVVTDPKERKSIIVSRSFGERVQTKEELVKALSTFVSKACVQLRKCGLVAENIILSIETSRFRENYVNKEWQARFPRPTNDTQTMVHEVLEGIDSIFEQGPLYARGGVLLYNLQREELVAGNLLYLDQEEQDKRQKRLMETMDAINERYAGKAQLRFAVTGDEDAKWRMKQEKLSAPSVSWETLHVAHCK